MKTMAINKRAHFDYELMDRYEGGLVLTGAEVKSVKTGNISLKGSFIVRKDGELYLINANIPQYKHASNLKSYDPVRSRKLLLKKSEIKSLIGKMAIEGLTLVPIRVYNTQKGLLKIEFAVAKGKKEYDKRSSIKEREDKRRMQQRLKNF
jgi:SsrA-binding protein